MQIVIIGGGYSGMKTARALLDRGLKPVVIEQLVATECPDQVDLITGKGVISQPHLVSVLNPSTGDEIRIVEASVVILATGIPSEENAQRLSGLSKYGVQYDSEGRIRVDSSGRTNAAGFYATGGCASQDTPALIDEICSLIEVQLQGGKP